MLPRLLLVVGFFVLPHASFAQLKPDPNVALQDLLTSDKAQNNRLIEAYERGYRRGRDEEARRARIEAEKPKSEPKK